MGDVIGREALSHISCQEQVLQHLGMKVLVDFHTKENFDLYGVLFNPKHALYQNSPICPACCRLKRDQCYKITPFHSSSRYKQARSKAKAVPVFRTCDFFGKVSTIWKKEPSHCC